MPAGPDGKERGGDRKVNKLLSQEEVDSLLKGLDTGDIEAELAPAEEERDLAVFDWTSQGRNIKLNMPLLDVIHNRFSQRFRGTLSSSLRKMVAVHPEPPDVIKFGAFQRSLPVPTSMHLFKMEPLRGMGILVMESRLAFSLVEFFFGGSGTGPAKIEDREFTPIEKKVIDKVVQMALMDLMEAWEDFHPIRTEFVRAESNPLVVNVVPAEEYLVSVKLEVELDRPLGALILSMPYTSLQSIRTKLSGGYRDEESAEVDHYWVNGVRDRLMSTDVELAVDLGTAELAVRELLNLKAGDIIVLNKDFRDTLTAKVEGIPKYQGYVGRFNNRKVFKVEDALMQQN